MYVSKKTTMYVIHILIRTLTIFNPNGMEWNGICGEILENIFGKTWQN